jgi:hypothetical protein
MVANLKHQSIFNTRSITTHGQMKRLPHQGARHGTVDHGDASDGVFLLLHLWVLPSSWRSSFEDLPPLSLACGWPLGANGSLSCEWRRLHELRVEDPSGARKGGRSDPRSGPGRPAWADRPRPIPTRFGRPFAPVGPHAFMHFAPSTCDEDTTLMHTTTIGVGDRPKGPLKQWGNPHLNPRFEIS